MPIRFELRTLVWCMSVSALLLFSPAASGQDSGAVALSERFAQMARETLNEKHVGKPELEISTALLEAAVRENPKGPRLMRLLIEAYLETGNTDAALKTLGDYRAIEPGDRQAQIQIIDIYLSRMESAETREKYLKDLLNNDGVSPEVRAHAGVKAAKVAMDRGQESQAKALLDQALGLNSVEAEGLRMRYELARNSTTLERTKALLALLRANPAQPAVMARLAAEFAAAGMTDKAIDWYGRSFALAQKMGSPLDPNDFFNSAIEQLVSGQGKAADSAIIPLLQSDPQNLSAITLRLLAARQVGDKDAQAHWSALSFEILANRINALDTAINGKNSSTTKPSTNPADRLPALVADAKLLAQGGNPDLHDAFAQALIDFSWLEIYYNEKPALAAPAIEALKLLVPADSAILARLEGWSFLMQNRNEEAKVKLSAVADKDPLSEAGMLRLAPTDQKAKSVVTATVLLQENPDQLDGATLLDALRPLGAKVTPNNDAAPLMAELATFPMEWLTILDTPKNFYGIKAEPLKVTHLFGEPMLIRVTLQNISKYELSIGPEGVIRPDLWFDATLRGVQQGDFKGVAYERMGQQLVLRPTEATSIVARVDRGPLRNMLMTNPVAAISIYFSVFTNPVQGGQAIMPGPGGFREQAKSVVERAPSPVANAAQQQAVFQQLANSDPAVRISTAELLATYAQILKNQANAVESQKLAADNLVKMIDPLITDSSLQVRSWVSYLMVALVAPEKRLDRVQHMLADQQWEMKMAGLAAASMLSPAEQSKTIVPLEKDADSVISRFARGLDARTKAAASQPTTAATTQAAPRIPVATPGVTGKNP